ncbi:MAG TPA: trehalose-phosphatase [Burkholderiales bacterium]|nr:trehalose-phosphatase [Burkholderiales bacterium]
MRLSKARVEQAPELRGRCAFFLDVDGTLLDIADHPGLIRADGDLVRLLKALARAAQGALALISGRPIADIDRLIPDSGFCIAGQHGAERRDFSGTMHRREVPRAALEEARRRLAAIAAKHPALVLEDKGVNFALHFRAVPGLGAEARDAVRGLAHDLGGEFEVQLGKMVVELRPTGKDKGVAISEYLAEAPFHGRTPVFVGDDLTDETGFELINRTGGHSVKVGEGESAARWRLPDSAAVRAWLADFAARSGGSA